MSGSRAYHVERSDDFEDELASFLKRYYKRDTKSLRDFLALLETLFESFRANPRNKRPAVGYTSAARREPWPRGASQEGKELWKCIFVLPGHAGEAGQGRLMYLVDCEHDLVSPFIIYTHKNHKKRPPDKKIKRILKRYLR